MEQQEFKAWRPVEEIPDEFIVEAMHDDWEGFRILLRHPDPTLAPLRIVFESPVGYRNINESYRLRTWSLDFQRSKGGLYVIQQSLWIEFLIAEAGGLLDHAQERLVHYAVYTVEDCIDIVTEFPPDVEWL